jgi:septum formation protein
MIILASQSEIRRRLLTLAGVTFEAMAAPIDEKQLQTQLNHLPPQKLATTLAHAKAEAIIPVNPTAVVIGVDQTLELEGRCLHKPATTAEARNHLESLSGKTHALHTAYCMIQQGVILAQHCQTSKLTMRSLSPAFLDHYLASCPPSVLSSVGCYQLEGLGIQLMENIEGDYFSILGLPLLALLADLRACGEVAT